MTPDEAVRDGISFHQQGRLDLAEPLYRRALQAEPNHPDALHLLGLIALDCRRFPAAAQLIGRAIEQKPGEHIYYGNLGVVFEKMGDLCKAEAAHRRAISISPTYAEGFSNLGQILRLQGRLEEADVALRRAVELRPDFADAWNNLAVASLDRNEFEQARLHAEQAVRLVPTHTSALCNLGIALISLHRHDEATEAFRRALTVAPNHHLVYHGLATIDLKLGKLNDALRNFEQALQLEPNYAESWIHLGCVFDELERSNAAIEAFQKAAELAPDNPAVYFNLGRVLSRAERFEEAVVAFEHCLRIRSDDAEALSLLVCQLQHLCRWDDLESLTRRLVERIQRETADETAKPGTLVNPSTFSILPLPTSWELQYRCAKAWSRSKFPAHEPLRFVHVASPFGRKIRLGYLSADWRTHVMASHTAELYEVHDRSRFEVFGYSIGPDDGSPIRKRIAAAFDRFDDGWEKPAREIAEKIHRDGVDILIDLQGHTLLSRPDIYAYKPAPIQVTYLGFAGSTGADYMNYILVDDYVAPTYTQPYFSERLVQLPDCYQVNQSRIEIAPRIPTREECGLGDASFVYCAFNNFFKITPAVFDVWMRLLRSVPGSVLWIPVHVAAAVDNLRREAVRRGVEGRRLVFAPRVPLNEHTARHRLADLFLDTFPYNAHGTASLSLRAGVPIVTMTGEQMASRVAGSLLREVGLPELIASNLEEYERIALELALNPKALQQVKNRLLLGREQGTLFNCTAFARNVERAYEVMMERYRSGRPPLGFKLEKIGHVAWLS